MNVDVAGLASRLRRHPETALIRLFEPLLVMALAWLAADLAIALLTPVAAPPAAVVQSTAGQTVTEERRFASLLRLDPFHRARPAVQTAAAMQLAESTLDLKLFGIRSGPGGGSAIIRTPDKRQGVWRVGAELLDGVRLVDVRPDMVVIERDGRREGLFLQGDAARRPRGADLAPVAVAAVSSALFEGVRLRPRLVRGEIDGIVIEFTDTATILQRTGLISGDVLLGANGVPLDSVAAVTQLFADLRGAAAILIAIEREGTRQEVRLSIEG